jgi:uncharacterized membrane protein
MTEAVVRFFSEFPAPRLAIFIISLLPVLELRLGLIAAAAFGVPLPQAFGICFLGNILPIPIILIFIKSVLKLMKRFKLTRAIAEWVERRAGKNTKPLARRQMLGLFLFVAVPLPGTGAWTGALAASLLDMPMKRSFPAICAGVLCAGVIMVTVTYFVPGLFGF